MRRKLVIGTLIVVVLLAGALSASAVSGTVDVTGLTDAGGCSVTSLAIYWDILGETDDDGLGNDGWYGILYDGDGTPLHSDEFAYPVGSTFVGADNFSGWTEGVPATRPFTLIMYDIDQVGPGQLPVATVEAFPIVMTDTFDPGLYSVDCAALPLATTPPAEEVVEEPVPGCDVSIAVPSNAVGARITAETPVYWKPGEMSAEVFPADLTLLALGVDESGAYTKVLYVCGYYWVPTSVIGPNYDEVWAGAPLPTDVVD